MARWFDECKGLNELKSVYRKLCKENHPDLGGDTATMQDINAAYDAAFNRLKDVQNAEAEHNEKVHRTTEAPEAFRSVVEKLVRLEGLEVELCGSWLWIAGDTYNHREALKEAGCMWSRSKKKWYWRHAEDGARWSRGKKTMGEIRSTYGSEYLTVKDDDRKRIA